MYLLPLIKKVATEYKERLEALYGNELAEVILFTSYARSDNHGESDLDFAIVFKIPIFDPPQKYQELSLFRRVSFGDCEGSAEKLFCCDARNTEFEILNSTMFRWHKHPTLLYLVDDPLAESMAESLAANLHWRPLKADHAFDIIAYSSETAIIERKLLNSDVFRISSRSVYRPCNERYAGTSWS